MNKLPTEYHIEVYEESFRNDPVWGAESTTPFLAISKGDRFCHRVLGDVAFYSRPEANQYFRVRDIEHILWTIKDDHIGHKLLLALELITEKD